MSAAGNGTRGGAAATGFTWVLACESCGAPCDQHVTSRCGVCGGTILAHRQGGVKDPGIVDKAPGIWRYAPRLGLNAETAGLSLGESMTPLIEAPKLAERFGVVGVSLKLDSLCPTGSFKDRSVAAGVAHALAAGAPGVVCASSGNAAASTAAYAARAGLPAVVVMPEHTPPGKLAASGAYGATQLLIPGDYSNSFAVAESLAERLGFVNLTTTYINPLAVTGLRSVAYDLADQASSPVTTVIVPTSAGPLVHGAATGFQDLVTWGLVEASPRLVVAQPAGCSPVARAFTRGQSEVVEWELVETTVSGLDDPLRGYATDGTVTLRDVQASGGSAHAIPDDEIEQARRELAHEHGVFVEAAAATSVAALAHLAAQRRLEPAEHVVCLLTGHGMKRPPTHAAEPHYVATVEEAVRVLEGTL